MSQRGGPESRSSPGPSQGQRKWEAEEETKEEQPQPEDEESTSGVSDCGGEKQTRTKLLFFFVHFVSSWLLNLYFCHFSPSSGRGRDNLLLPVRSGLQLAPQHQASLPQNAPDQIGGTAEVHRDTDSAHKPAVYG